MFPTSTRTRSEKIYYTDEYYGDKYSDILKLSTVPDSIYISDHLGGFTKTFENGIFNNLNVKAQKAQKKICVYYDEIIDDRIRLNYPNLEFKFYWFTKKGEVFSSLENYKIHPELDFKNFLCSFNGAPHNGRKLLVSIIEKFGWFNPDYSSKNFQLDAKKIDGYVSDYVTGDQERIYNKFFTTSDNFNQTIYRSFGKHNYEHGKNIHNLENQLTKSFLNLVSETEAMSYYPHVTEKFLYSIITRGLYLAYAPPGWHEHVEKYYGFKRYNKLFDYGFDSIQNPIKRLVELISMIQKFSILSSDDWRDLYLLELDTITFNYNHYFSKDYQKCLAKYV